MSLSYQSKSAKTRFYSAASKKVLVIHSEQKISASPSWGRLKSSPEGSISKLDPNFVTGFADGEGCFSVTIVKNINFKVGWEVLPCFQLTQHTRDRALLEQLKFFFAAGNIYREKAKTVQFLIKNQKDLATVFYHFKKFKLITKKLADFKLWCVVIEIIQRGEHLTPDGLRKIVALRAAMNLGLSDKLKLAFPDVVPVERPLVEVPLTIEPEWLAGFTCAEGCFFILITESKTSSVGHKVQLVYQLTQHARDQILMFSIKEFHNCGNVTKDRDCLKYRVTKFQDVCEKIIPFFKKYKIRGVKALDFADFCRAAELKKEKKHLTAEGLEEIRKIKASMNRGRYI